MHIFVNVTESRDILIAAVCWLVVKLSCLRTDTMGLGLAMTAVHAFDRATRTAFFTVWVTYNYARVYMSWIAAAAKAAATKDFNALKAAYDAAVVDATGMRTHVAEAETEIRALRNEVCMKSYGYDKRKF